MSLLITLWLLVAVAHYYYIYDRRDDWDFKFIGLPLRCLAWPLWWGYLILEFLVTKIMEQKPW